MRDKMKTKTGGDAAPASAPVLGRRERNKMDKLRRIKEAAWELFTSKGFDDTTTREIAAAADVGLGTVFIYAANKRDLLFLIANDGLEDVEARAQSCVDPHAPLLENLINVFRHHYEFFGRQPTLSRLVLREMTFYEAGAQVRPLPGDSRSADRIARTNRADGDRSEGRVIRRDPAIHWMDSVQHLSGRTASVDRATTISICATGSIAFSGH